MIALALLLPVPRLASAEDQAWNGEYFANTELAGSPTHVRSDSGINFNWGLGSPNPKIPVDHFSARWTRSLYLPAGHYLFKTIVDDGVRIWLDWATVIDQWHDSTIWTYQREIEVREGYHTMVVEYYQGSGTGQIAVSWQNTAIDWVGNLSTCMPAQHSWVKVFRLSPNNQWEDLKPEGYGPSAASGELKIWGLPIDPIYGWDGQPYIVELWADGKLVRSDGKFTDGQPQFVLTPGADIHTSWPCGAAVPRQ